MDTNNSQNFESFVPVYDAIPEKWEESRPFIVEQLKRVAQAINIREIGWFIDEELLSGKAFIPGSNNMLDQGTSQTFRQVFRKVVDCGALVAGVNTIEHGINYNENFTLVQLWAAVTNSETLMSTTFANADTIRLTDTNIIITSNGTYDRSFTVIEYLQEV